MSGWTQERVDLAKKLNADGLTASQIAGEIGVSRNAVIGKLRRLGVILAGSKFNVSAQRRQKGYVGNRNNFLGRNGRVKRIIGKSTIDSKERKRMPDGAMAPDTAALSRYDTAPLPDGFLSIPFDDLQPRHCRYPRGENPILFCGQPAIQDSSYCASCHARCYTPHRPVADVGKLWVESISRRQRRAA